MTSRDAILRRLRAVKPPYADEPPPAEYLPVVPLDASDRAALIDRFVTKAEALSSVVHRCASEEQARATVLDIISPDDRVLCWDFVHIPLPGLAEALDHAGIAIAPPDDASVRVGITGADAALAATGSLVIASGAGKPRRTSLLPLVHVAVARAEQILPHMEAWIAEMRARGDNAFTDPSSIVIVSGPSRTADIAMELILGMHGPGALHIVLIESEKQQ
jgi:L-lactate dehydrogenase complex protein LldG